MLKIVKDSVLKVTRSLGYDTVPLRDMKERDFSIHPRELLTRLDDTELVTVRTLDLVMPILQECIGFRRPYLKIDTQGFDIEVLRGARDSLPGIKALQTEASVISIYKRMPRYMDTMRLLDERGFDITGFYPVSRDSAPRLVEFDCIMINRSARIAPPRAASSPDGA